MAGDYVFIILVGALVLFFNFFDAVAIFYLLFDLIIYRLLVNKFGLAINVQEKALCA